MLSNVVRSWNEMSTYRKIRRVISIGLIIFGVWALSPYFYNRTVNEAFPAAPAAPTAMAESAAGQAMAEKPAAAPTVAASVASQAMPDQPAATSGAMADEPAGQAMAGMPSSLTDEAMADSPPAPDAMAESAGAPAGPVALLTGNFIAGSFPGDTAAGTATVYRLEDGQQVLRLEAFSSTNGPDLFVTFHTGANPEQDAGEYFQIAALKGNQGNQNYELPADIDLGQYKSVVIWCRAFNIVFGYATLQQASQ